MKKVRPTLAAVHDISGYGRASLTVVIPILSKMGVRVCPLPTAVLSAHSEYSNFYCVDLTSHLRSIIGHWKELNLEFDSIYSGYLANYEQIEIVKDFIKDFRKEKQLVVVDPVMGDGGELYSGFDEKIVSGMQDLIQDADIITPNLTEASFLSGVDIKDLNNEDSILQCAKQLSLKGPKYVVITSILMNSNKDSGVLIYEKSSNTHHIISRKYIHASYPGTGDAFTSVLTGSMLQGNSLIDSVNTACDFILKGIECTINSSHNPLDGINQEEVLPTLKSIYEE